MRYLCCVLALLLCSCAGHALEELPQRSPGLWEVTLVSVETARRSRPAVIQQCTGLGVDTELLLSVAPGQESCSPPTLRRRGEAVHVHTRCRVHGEPNETHFALRGDFSQTYAGSYDTRYSGSCPTGHPDCRVAQEFQGRYLGACPENMHPGDVRLPNGIIVSPLDHPDHDEAAPESASTALHRPVAGAS